MRARKCSHAFEFCGEKRFYVIGFFFCLLQSQLHSLISDLKHTQSADDHGEEGEVENQHRDEEDEEVDCEVGDDEEEDKGVHVVSGDQGAEPLHAGARRPVDQMLFYFQQGVQRKLQHLGGNTRNKRSLFI